MICNESERVLGSSSQSQIRSSPTYNQALKRHKQNGDRALDCSATIGSSFTNHCGGPEVVGSNTDLVINPAIESDLICDFTEPTHLTMTIRRPENILKLLTEKDYGENGAKNGVSAIIRSHSDSNSSVNRSPKLLTSKEFCKFLKSYKLTIKPFGAAESDYSKIENSKRKLSSTSRWRCSANQAKTRPSKLKWHHTNFNGKLKRSSTSTPSFVTSLTQAYLDQATRDQALAETLKTTPTQYALKYTTRNDDPCLVSATRSDNRELLPDPELLKRSVIKTADLRSSLGEKANLLLGNSRLWSADSCVTIDEDRPHSERNHCRETADEENKTNSQISFQQSRSVTEDILAESSSSLESSSENELTMETLEFQTHSNYPASQAGMQTSSIFHNFTDMDIAIADEIMKGDLFDEGLLMKEFFSDQTFADSDFVTHNESDYLPQTEAQDPLAIATSTILGSVTQEPFTMTQHQSPMSSPASIQKTPLYEHPGCFHDGYVSSDSGINSPASMTSPCSDVCGWKSDAEGQIYFKYAVAPRPLSPEKYTTSETEHHCPEPQLLNMDVFSQAQNIPESLNHVEVQPSHCDARVPSPMIHLPSPQAHVPTVLQAPLVPTRSKRPSNKRTRKGRPKNVLLWEFIRDILLDSKHCPSLIKWEDRQTGLFRFVESDTVASMWGKTKRNPKMNYEKLSRAMRYYYNRGILDRVDGRRLVYKFGVNAHGWREVSEPDKPVQNNAPAPAPAAPIGPSSPTAWTETEQSGLRFVPTEPAGLQSLETSSSVGQLLPSASVLLPKWESAL